MRAERLAELALPERLQDAVAEAKRLKSFGAKRRQVQYIGKLMRKLDEEMLAAIRKAVRARASARSAPVARRGASPVS